MSIIATKKKIGNFIQKVGNEWYQIFARQSLPKELEFYLNNYTYATLKTGVNDAADYSPALAYEVGDLCKRTVSSVEYIYKNIVAIPSGEPWNEQHWRVLGVKTELIAGLVTGEGYWDNQNIVTTVSGTNLAEGHTPTCTNPKMFKSLVGDVEGSYVFTYAIQTGTVEYKVWTCPSFPGAEVLTADLESTYGIADVVPGTVAPGNIPTFTVVLTFDAGREQYCKVPDVTTEMVGSVGVSQTATKAQYDAAAYGQLRCIGQSGVEGAGDGKIVIVSYGVTPTIDIPCIISDAFEFNRESENPTYS